MEAGENFGDDLVRREIDDGDGAFVRDVAHGIHADEGAASGGAGDAVGVGTASAPIAHVSLAAREHDVVRRDADFPEAEKFAGGGVVFAKAVGEIERDVEARAIGRDGEAGGDFVRAPDGIDRRQRDGEQGGDLVRPVHGEDLHAAVDVGEINARAVGREDEAGVANLPLLVGREDVAGNGVGRGIQILLRGQRDALENFPADRLDDHDLRGLAGGEEDLAIRTERERLRAKAGQFDLDPGGREDLVGRRDEAVRSRRANALQGTSGAGEAGGWCVAATAEQVRGQKRAEDEGGDCFH